ncbi:alpha/beta hydrolase [Amycolatopsis nigrescens]|uniref:alpha/beta hydrolase n=1 Tax=Amycolatopsis nigrescens TaxID=381445 RepID=UPI00036147C1|nr:alpha/beta hydrolase [Amycolatopsis nigrescens]
MVTWADVLRWDPAPTQQAVGPINTEYLKLVGASDELRTAASVEGWSGPAAGAAIGRVNQLVDATEELAAELGSARRAFGDVGDAITGVVHAREEAIGLAQAQRFTIGPDGAITDPGPPPGTPPEQAEAVAAERQRFMAELKDRVEQVVRQANDIDSDACAVLDKILSGTVVDTKGNDNATTGLAAYGDAGFTVGGLSILSPPADGATVAQNAAWWATLSPNQQRRLIHDLPELVGNRDGVQGWARSEANLALVGKERTTLQNARANLQGQLEKLTNGPGHQNTRNLLQAELAKINDKLSSLDSIDKMMLDPRTRKPLEGRQLLSLDMGGDRAKAAVATGNIDTAKHVGVFTPGMNSNVQGSLSGYVEDMDEVRRYANGLAGDSPTGNSVAMVTWLGYEPPTLQADDMRDVGGLITGAPASEGANKLANFQEGINASRRDDPHLTALGHSYGSTTTGIALTQNHGVDDAVFFGSPGISETPTPVFNTSNLNIPEGHAYNLSAEGDDVADAVPVTTRYGPHLESMPGMNQLSTDGTTGPQGPMAASHGHSEYAKGDGRMATSEYNMAAIVSGHPELAVSK